MDFEPLKRAYRNWRRMHVCARPPAMPEPFFATDDVDALNMFFQTHPVAATGGPGSADILHGSTSSSPTMEVPSTGVKPSSARSVA